MMEDLKARDNVVTDYSELAKQRIAEFRAKNGFNEVSDTIKASETAKTGVRDLEVGTYGSLNSKSIELDGLQHDHIPSFAAIKKARETELGEKLTIPQKKALQDVTNTIAVTNEIHRAGRTWFYKNTATQVAEDALNLKRAAGKDFRTHYKNLVDAGYDPKIVLEAITELHRKNLSENVYNIGR